MKFNKEISGGCREKGTGWTFSAELSMYAEEYQMKLIEEKFKKFLRKTAELIGADPEA